MTIINDFVKDFVALIGKKITITDKMVDMATKFYNLAKNTEKPAKKEKKEKKAGPNKPLNAYMIFSGAIRLEFKTQNPEMSPKQLTSKIAKQWNEEKAGNTQTYQKYTKLAEEASLKYKEEKSKSESENEESEEGEKKEKKKRAPSAYNIFYSKKYAELSSGGKKNGEIMKEISALWKAMSPEEKEAYKDQELNTEKAKVESGIDAPPKKTKEVKEKKGTKEVKA